MSNLVSIEAAEQPVQDAGMDWLAYLKDPSVPFDERLDRWEAFVSQFDPVECPLVHQLPDGLYCRTIVMPAGAIVVSQIHKKDNPFFIQRGRVTVISENEKVVEYKAPHMGITKPGTRRLLFVHEDTEWTTVHPNPDNISDLQELESLYVEMKPTTRALRDKQQALLTDRS